MTAVAEPLVVNDAPAQRSPRIATLILALAVGLGGAVLAHRLVPQIGILTWAVALGVLAANLGAVPTGSARILGRLTRRFLRIGIVLLGFSVSFTSIAALGVPLVTMVAITLLSTLFFTTWLGRRVGLSPSRALLLGTGTAICGASAIAAMEETAEASDEDVTVSIAMVTLFGTIALVLLPLLQQPLGLTGEQLAIWAGASVHEVGQVVAAASPAGAAFVATAVVVKLTRVVMLAPVVGAVSAVRRYRSRGAQTAATPPLVPLFVLGFLACVGLRTVGAVPEIVLTWIQPVQIAALGAAMFGMGASVRFASLLRGSGRVVAVAAGGSLFIGLVSLAGLLLVTR
ncbi:MAG: putative sulfate exporter family transporter [Nocardiaceae bacterium]|nr:putative sulfate exporter family transporter [Nocardiaceae bacterium]